LSCWLHSRYRPTGRQTQHFKRAVTRQTEAAVRLLAGNNHGRSQKGIEKQTHQIKCAFCCVTVTASHIFSSCLGLLEKPPAEAQAEPSCTQPACQKRDKKKRSEVSQSRKSNDFDSPKNAASARAPSIFPPFTPSTLGAGEKKRPCRNPCFPNLSSNLGTARKQHRPCLPCTTLGLGRMDRKGPAHHLPALELPAFSCSSVGCQCLADSPVLESRASASPGFSALFASHFQRQPKPVVRSPPPLAEDPEPADPDRFLG
jgi:hypothetical protein